MFGFVRFFQRNRKAMKEPNKSKHSAVESTRA
jgi:hypothetical protein